MKDRFLWRVAILGLTAGLVLMMIGSLVSSDLAPLARGYGLLVVVAAVYLAAGLAVRARISRRSSRQAGVRGSGAASHSSSRPA
jgi:4-hydroxybenzoate polyprenyltransferase